MCIAVTDCTCNKYNLFLAFAGVALGVPTLIEAWSRAMLIRLQALGVPNIVGSIRDAR
ncbi:MAG TPA: hypothetical protein VFE53_10625 [Mucilaginibacter sp.]|nr:hypothetical protein [Mucilaginibacter sp.]